MEDKKIQNDIDSSKESKSVHLKMVDGMISANFGSYGMHDMISYDKIFKTWKEFTDYTDSFFKLN